MRINIEAVKQLVTMNFKGKLSLLAREIHVDYSYLNSVMNGHKSAGSKKICDGLISYCNNNNLDYRTYIIL